MSRTNRGKSKRRSKSLKRDTPSKPLENSKTLECLKLRHFLAESVDTDFNHQSAAILNILGGTKAPLRWLLTSPYDPYLDKQKLLSLLNLLRRDTEQHQGTEDDIENDEETNSENKPMFDLRALSHDMTSYLCCFLEHRDIHSLQQTSTDLAFICLEEIKKCDIGVIPF